MRRFFILALAALTVFGTESFAQGNTTVNGRVTDNTGKSLSAVTVSLLQAKDSSLIKAAITDADGKFQINTNKSGDVLLSYSLLGFEKTYSPVFSVTSGQDFASGNIKLAPESKQLKEVVVTSKKPMIEIKADKTIFNVENSINATGSNALELLQKSPGIQVDNNDNISMKGKTGVKIYIDGKMTQLDS
jgi:iron complex outermembrane recepter protein